MTEETIFPIGEGEQPQTPSRPRRWWVAAAALLLAATLVATLIPGLLPREKTGSGTGFIVAEEGYVLTAAHVVQGAAEITVFHNGRGHRATLIAVSVEHDLALLVIEDSPPLPVAALAEGRPEFGDAVTAVGHPSGATRPIALSTHVAGTGWWAVGPESTVLRDLIATRDTFRPGYSGSPLVNAAGQVVGIVTGSVTSGSGQAFGFAVSIQRAAGWLASRGMTLPLHPRHPGPPLSEADLAARVSASVVRVEARFPPGSR